jgi:hypothetical protein
MFPSVKVGTYTGTGAALNVVLGFVPDFLFIVNVTDGDLVGMWFDGMAAGTGVDIAAAVASNAADGVTRLVGDDGEGFTVGTDYSESAKVYRYFAARSGPGGNDSGAVSA